MDLYYGCGANDFLIPKDQDLLDRDPSPDSWSKWEMSASEAYNSPTKFLIMDTNATEEGFNFIDESFNNEIEFKPSVYDKDQSSSSSVSGAEQSFQQTAFSCDQPNYQLQDLSSFEQMDNIFLDSVLEDFPSVEDLHKSFYYYPENHGSDSPGGLQKDISASKFVPSHSNSEDCMDIKTVKVLDPFERYSGDDTMHEQSSVEESILQDLEMVIAQFTVNTRICFRDALYCLARNNKQQLNLLHALRPWFKLNG
ncbi:protein LNK4-like [Gastrolobium bilobum]|uniref:protein LNK4-like n=1 Tax=Gastrolobium bilobum TaxID=150636 RepID=UPI002AAF281D|nr:protein LNK4-like [Gastrolobium bilobum]